MGLFDFLKTPDINAGVEEFRGMQGAVLLDVRTRQEYAMGRIPGSVNIPLQRIEDAEDEIDKTAEVFTYCQSGVRSRQAAQELVQMGFTKVHNIGGIGNYRGELEV